MGTCVLYIGLVEAGYQSNFLLVASIYFGTDVCIYIYIYIMIYVITHTHVYIYIYIYISTVYIYIHTCYLVRIHFYFCPTTWISWKGTVGSCKP